MKPTETVKLKGPSERPRPARAVVNLSAILLVLLIVACDELEKPKTKVYFAEAKPPEVQEFRWSNGKAPKSLDPARAIAPPETDVVRAVFEGLTELDAKTLNEIPAAAEKWKASEDFSQWTFHIREDAKWSNGEPLTAADFVRSWKRAAAFGRDAPNAGLLNNIVGMRELVERSVTVNKGQTADSEPKRDQNNATPTTETVPTPVRETVRQANLLDESGSRANVDNPVKIEAGNALKIGAVAEEQRTLKVTLVNPDPDFPKLTAHPIFRPVYDESEWVLKEGLNTKTVTNGAFQIVGTGPEGLTLERSKNYWNREAVKLERVKFVPAATADEALEAYRSGRVDAVTNADFSPLALKLLAPYDDFRRSTYSAINFYEVNSGKPPFDDRRIRQALAISIERERLTDGELEGSTRPAFSFLPFGSKSRMELVQDKEKASELLMESGFPNGRGFPVIRLLVNRNDTQLRVARLVARMWKRNLSIETEIIVKEPVEVENARVRKDFDIVRRGVVLPTTSSAMNLSAIFGWPNEPEERQQNKTDTESPSKREAANNVGASNSPSPSPSPSANTVNGKIITEEEALFEMRAIPLYFPSSYSLLKPYVVGFEINGLDAVLLFDVSIDGGWQLEPEKPAS